MPATFVVQYSYVSDILDRRQPYRAEHLGRITAAASDGRVLLSGALADPVDGAVLVFRADGRAQVEEWVRADPYHVAGLITDFTVREITLVVPTA
ncbi:YciI family protein [Blastococcus saxobsidens]|uniref:YCII-related domain-containing protein n=1 Tax=Blastococcus saxobsidens TaxID=138336 RepID=A0A4Q7Y6S4_9ACTN|nr:YciI family protein [Blastococcus saxobsidens]RZU32214.1 hypothetical protein BKA19_1909 [Blastococcus saxobsidens]